MSDLELEVEQLRVRLTHPDGKIRIDFRGTARIQDPRIELAPFLDRATEEAAAAGALLEVHIEEAVFFNSAAMGAMIRFIKSTQDRRVGIELSFDPGQDWQRHFAHALRPLARRSDQFTLRPT
jgi:hypothetical protein